MSEFVHSSNIVSRLLYPASIPRLICVLVQLSNVDLILKSRSMWGEGGGSSRSGSICNAIIIRSWNTWNRYNILQYITRLNTGEIDKFVLVDVSWCGVLCPAWQTVEQGSSWYHYYFMFGFSCQTLPQYPSISWIIEIFDCKFGQESNIVKSNFMITKLQTYASSGYFPFQTTNWLSLSDGKL